MPLSEHGKKVLAKFTARYGTKKGTELFYARQVEGKGGKGSKRWESGPGTGKLNKAIRTHAKRSKKKIKKGTLL